MAEHTIPTIDLTPLRTDTDAGKREVARQIRLRLQNLVLDHDGVVDREDTCLAEGIEAGT